MSYINCPECKKIISDKIKFCPGCGFPIGEFTDPALGDEEEDGISYAVSYESQNDMKSPVIPSSEMYRIPQKNEKTDAAEEIVPSKEYESVIRKSEAPLRKKRRVYAAAASVILAAAVITGVIVSLWMGFSPGNSTDNENSGSADISQTSEQEMPLDMSDTYITGTEVRYNDRFMNLESSEKRPFVAVVEDKEYLANNDDPYYYYILMDEGCASKLIETDYFGSDLSPEEKFAVRGSLEGYEIGAKDIEKHTVGKNFTENTETYHTEAVMTTEVILKEKISGLLFYELPVNESRRGVTGGYMTVYNGSGKAVDAVYDLEYGTKSISVKFIPRYFVPCEELTENDYSFTREPSINIIDSETEHDDITFTGALEMNEKSDGSILMRFEFISNPVSSVTPVNGTKRSFVKNGKASYYVHIDMEKQEQEYDPECQITAFGFVRIVPFGVDENG